jgi:hypothetical protein
MVRNGLVACQNWPSSSEIGTRPTHIQTNTKPNQFAVLSWCTDLLAVGSGQASWTVRCGLRPRHVLVSVAGTHGLPTRCCLCQMRAFLNP